MCTGSWVLARAGLLDGLPAAGRTEPDRSEAEPPGMVPVDRLARLAPACRISRARVVDAGRVTTAAGISAGMEMGLHLLRRAGYDEAFIDDVARVMEYARAYDAYRDDREAAEKPSRRAGQRAGGLLATKAAGLRVSRARRSRPAGPAPQFP